MDYRINPFQELYRSDDLAKEFVHVFSDVPLRSAVDPLFQEGNVVLAGTQGCGKTMLLQLLRPDTRIAYFDEKKSRDFPISEELRNFISAGVNLVKSGMPDIAGVTLNRGDDHDVDQLPYYFADFFNYWVTLDLLRTVENISTRKDVFGDLCHSENLDAFAVCLASQDCWVGAMAECRTFLEVKKRIEARVAVYRRWVGFNELLPDQVRELAEQKTTIGEPIARTASCLVDSGVITPGTRVFIRIDQLEELHQSPEPRQARIRSGFRRILNRALASRDGRVHYRIGTRRYAWNAPEQLVIHGSGAQLELRRDYLLIDLENELFTRKENRKGWLFPDFAQDAFRRRIAYSLKSPDLLKRKDLAATIFGQSPRPTELIKEINQRSQDVDAAKGLELNRGGEEGSAWTTEWKEWLEGLYQNDPLKAVMAAAWGRQTGGRGKKAHRDEAPPEGDQWLKIWWHKERVQLALLQHASRRSQRMIWWGFNDILALSGGNITAFLSICHKIWDVFLKEENLKPAIKRIDVIDSDSTIPQRSQSVGIHSASADWFGKIREQPGGDVRQRFVDELGRALRRQLREDRAMSYPGANGVSIATRDLDENAELKRFLLEAADYGDLVAIQHTTKNKAGESRLKFYLNPILSSHFQIPAQHPKEPLYWKADDFIKILHRAKVPFNKTPPKPTGEQMDFFGGQLL